VFEAVIAYVLRRLTAIGIAGDDSKTLYQT
jgi:hypothetical protein